MHTHIDIGARASGLSCLLNLDWPLREELVRTYKVDGYEVPKIKSTSLVIKYLKRIPPVIM